ncbi:S53 family peptidase [Levilactobacillus enshiensis]|uniref:S53 family peptidase n=1 Tax=Levilactobacillus enshiensis TaxID=2590213 RepID=UPI001179AB1A|nr:S53 family peptidase [Levilactobacillus enshiensis]
MKIRVFMASLLVGLGSFGVVANAAKTTPLATPYRASQLTSLKKIKNVAGDKPVTLDLVLKPRHTSQLTQTALAVNTPGSATFKDFLTPQTFRQRFGQSTSTTQRLTQYFKKQHLTVTTFNDGLFMELKGSAAAVDATFATNLKTARYQGTRLQYSAKQPRLPKAIAQPIEAVVGMTNLVKMTSLATSGTSTGGPTKTGAPQNFLTRYHATAVANQSQGKGQTVGIISFSKVDTRDITHFWSAEGVPASASRLSVAATGGASVWGNVDPGNVETSLDVEQAGALAPQAKIRVYTAALSDVGWINAFASAFGENQAGSLSLSWGISEGILREMDSAHLLTPLYGSIMNTLLAQGATQGISTFAATGDSGAYGEELARDGSVGYGVYANFPANNPWVTATGGTTLPISGQLPDGATVDISRERTWGGDALFDAYQQNRSFFMKSSDLLSMLQSGSGGGISTLYATPKYQQGVSGVNTYAARQYLTSAGLPRLHPGLIQGTTNGRNYPDVVADADPLTGYDVYAGSDGWETMGGTSFVAPQFAALAADINSDRSQRVGLWNPQLYSLAQSADSPFTRLDASTGNSNLYYVGQPGKTYNQAAGLGTLNFDKLAQDFK